MAIRTILALLSGGAEDLDVLDGAWSVAKCQAAHVSCLRCGPDLPKSLEYVSESAFHFDAWCQSRTPFVAEQPQSSPRASLDPKLAVDEDPGSIAARLRLSDLVIAARPDGWLAGTPAGVHSVLSEGGRPVLLMPPGGADSIGEKIVIAWNGSEQAARAVAFALPLLATARDIRIFHRSEQGDRQAGGGPAELVEHLACHGIEARPVSGVTGPRSIAEDLLSLCRHEAADLLVMGGYRHGWLRELLGGGVTRTILSKADLPVLMVH
jgi:nucleotide-binding universal stress UspA family protein